MFAPRIELEKKHLPIIATATALLYTFIYIRDSVRREVKCKTFKEIPTPGNSYPFVGNIFGLGRMPDRTIAKWHDELGPIIKAQLGVKTFISISEPRLAHKVLTSLGSKTSFRFQTDFLLNHYTMGEKGIAFSQPGGSWNRSRSAGLTVLAPKQIDKYLDYISFESSILADNFIRATKQSNHNGVCPFEYLNLYGINITTNIGFGKRFDSLDDHEYKKMSGLARDSLLLAGLKNNICDFLPFMSIINFFIGRESKMKDFIEKKRNPIFREYIRQARLQEGQNMIKTLDNNGSELSEDEMIVLMADFNVAGSDNISVNISWYIIFMCHYPDAQKIASDEIDTFIRLNGRLPLFSDRLSLPYCISVIKECMRYRPSLVFGIPREVHEDVELDGYIIEKGSIIAPNLYSMHRNIDFYRSPEVFFPERYMDNLRTMQASANGRVDNRDHFSFGWGRRSCPGSYISEAEIFSTFIAILSKCFIEPSADGMPDIDTTENKGLNNWPLPFKVRFVKRSDSLVE